MQNHKGFRRIICVTILCALLMVSMGKATRVSAVGTTATIAATAFILTGVVYVSYLGLTQASVALPVVDDLHTILDKVLDKLVIQKDIVKPYDQYYQAMYEDHLQQVTQQMLE